ncbi:MAG: hypothetical protein FD163_2517 [Hyphomonadaceae bacterium]|nr:MAG: hypothetical protein FD128_1586 [Hyphomonadaceae bacterium]KAF0182727.1 MAG: hypothetical protein FD163_2517 [Hyphomonadaceae bacterium]
MTSVKVSSAIKAQFRETARNIISNDRAARKLGMSQNTIGLIQSCLLKAYKGGYQAAILGHDENSISEEQLTWEMIPPKGRNFLEQLTMFYGRLYHPYMATPPDVDTNEVFLISSVIINGKIRWVIERHTHNADVRSFSNGAVFPLIKLGLFSLEDDALDLFKLTNLGVEICKEYWRRSDANDPTLPKSNIRH